MRRSEMLARLEDQALWDMVIIGGGATGLGAAIDAASRGYRVALLEQSDFAKGTSSRSTKLVHGGVRYLKQGNLSLVLEALKERGLLRQNAPHLVRDLPFVVPNYDWWEAPFYGIGLRIYDMLAGRQGFGPSRNLSKEATVERIPTIETEGLRGGVMYYDGQFDDARLAIHMAQTAAEQGATLLNYMSVVALERSGEMISGVVARDEETGRECTLRAKVVINATGVFSDAVRRMDDPEVGPLVKPSQGIHLVLDRSFLPGDTAIMVPHTDDGRVLFAIPWHNRTVVGTTDTEVPKADLEPRALDEEIAFLMEHTARYLSKDPVPSDVLSVFAGLRPLVAGDGDEGTAALSRDHTINISRSGLLTITGGKWTTYRKMAEDTIDHAVVIGALEDRPCITKNLHLHGYHQDAQQFGELSVYGADATAIQDLQRDRPEDAALLHPRLPYTRGELVWAIRHEMARTVEDLLARRTRALLLDARASMAAAADAAAILAAELDHDPAWAAAQAESYCALAAGYVLPGSDAGAPV